MKTKLVISLLIYFTDFSSTDEIQERNIPFQDPVVHSLKPTYNELEGGEFFKNGAPLVSSGSEPIYLFDIAENGFGCWTRICETIYTPWVYRPDVSSFQLHHTAEAIVSDPPLPGAHLHSPEFTVEAASDLKLVIRRRRIILGPGFQLSRIIPHIVTDDGIHTRITRADDVISADFYTDFIEDIPADKIPTNTPVRLCLYGRPHAFPPETVTQVEKIVLQASTLESINPPVPLPNEGCRPLLANVNETITCQTTTSISISSSTTTTNTHEGTSTSEESTILSTTSSSVVTTSQSTSNPSSTGTTFHSSSTQAGSSEATGSSTSNKETTVLSSTSSSVATASQSTSNPSSTGTNTSTTQVGSSDSTWSKNSESTSETTDNLKTTESTEESATASTTKNKPSETPTTEIIEIPSEKPGNNEPEDEIFLIVIVSLLSIAVVLLLIITVLLLRRKANRRNSRDLERTASNPPSSSPRNMGSNSSVISTNENLNVSTNDNRIYESELYAPNRNESFINFTNDSYDSRAEMIGKAKLRFRNADVSRSMNGSSNSTPKRAHSSRYK
ncbi:uncharacterized protein DDB_G0271670-like [Artemia franciscana]|uniref:uncharacterized protein DDB_G0271670-like n=1 Tax=Artemia franciscana TaxID=6661 RepID=UPI0032DBC81C